MGKGRSRVGLRERRSESERSGQKLWRVGRMEVGGVSLRSRHLHQEWNDRDAVLPVVITSPIPGARRLRM